MPRWGMVIDLDKCTGCAACVVACRAENNVPFAGEEQAAMGRAIHWMEIITEVEGEYPNLKTRYLPRPCFHCDDPPCIKVCPVGATYINEEGMVGQVYPRCIGCRYCMAACPYTARYFNWYEPAWPQSMEQQFNPDVSMRPKGVVEKCSFCHHRLIRAREQARLEGRPLIPQDYIPACVETCPAEAMTFGDLDDSASEVWKLSRSQRAFVLLEDLGTKPKVFYLAEGEKRAPGEEALSA
ncbi:MAG: 4Fe-4S dicluster domain-containing protein [Nitrospinota bacterium]